MGPIRVRSIPLLATGLSCLVIAAVLGGVLVHDGEIGTDDARLDTLQEGDEVRFKGEARPADVQMAGLLNHTMRLSMPDGDVLVTADHPLPREGTWVVVGTVVASDRLVIIAQAVHEPFLFG